MNYEIRVYYCKSLKKTGRPIIIEQSKNGDEFHEIHTDRVLLRAIDGEIKFNNTNGIAKKRGATTALQTTGTVYQIPRSKSIAIYGDEYE